VAAVAGGVALGAVRSTRPPLHEAVTIGGTLTYVWHGDPGRSCAAKGLCGSHGSLIVHFDGYGELNARDGKGSLGVDGASATARVLRKDGASQSGECVDAISVDAFGISLRRVHVGHWIATLDAAPVSGGRCAGPLARDLARLRLPAPALRVRGLGFDLHGHARFAGGPFSGELISTLVLRPDRTEESSTSGGDSTVFTSPPPRPPRHVLVEYARIRYRITGATGALGVNFLGDGEPDCVPLDNCATTGTLRLSVSGFGAIVQFSGDRFVVRRVPRARALADLRAGLLEVTAHPFPLLLNRSTTSETLIRSGSGRCVDTVVAPTNLLAGAGFGQVGRGIRFELKDASDGSDPWRTHCPGPSTADLIGGSAGPAFFFGTSFADGSLSTQELGVAHAAVVLRSRGRFRGIGYSGTRDGDVRFTLTLLGAAGGTRVETEPR
jgi:hypothetical protein